MAELDLQPIEDAGLDLQPIQEQALDLQPLDLEPLPEQAQGPSSAATMAARIAPAVAGGMLLGPPGGAIGGGLGEAYAQYLEGKFNSKQIALATALGLIPGARFASIRGAVPRIALRAGEGATMGAGSQVASNVIEGQPVLENVPQAAGLGLALGGAGGGAERLLTNRAAARAGQGQRAQAAVAEGQLPPMSEQEFMLAKQASDIDLQHPTYTQQQ